MATRRGSISLWEGLLVLKGQYTRAERTSYKKRKYFTLGGSAGLERPIHMSRENKLQEEKIFHFGRVSTGLERPIHMYTIHRPIHIT